jgi:hypothetical protein
VDKNPLINTPKVTKKTHRSKCADGVECTEEEHQLNRRQFIIMGCSEKDKKFIAK